MHPLLAKHGLYFDDDDGTGSGSGGGTGDSGGGFDIGSGGESKPISFSQADLDRTAGTARSEGRAAAEKKMADDLGIPLDKAKGIIERALAQEESEKSDAQKAREAADAEKVVAETAVAGAARVVHSSNVKDALRDAGVAKEKLAKVATLVEVEVGADEAAIVTAVGVTKKEFPELFGGTVGGAPSSDTGGAPAGKNAGGEDAMERGRKRAETQLGSGSESYPILEGIK